ncbi:cytochrome P450 [Streptomyces sp. 891-h]|uniref:cytochrome P450 n=1 Tax=unclassified Streptomyces TaxID=2593676 RepID=UPI001FAA8E71|nr:cytochrome P450 [Streptomyces sp. 891-h]UNZ16660.1 cytochrome P450 [Streptomyces sp. 891-h]
MNAQPSDGPHLAEPDVPAACPVRHAGATTRLYAAETTSDPYGTYSRLRKQYGPVAPVLLEGDVPAWLVLGYRENRRVLDNPGQFSRDSRRWRDWKEGRIAENSPLIPMLGWRPDCLSQDGEPHQRLRRAVTDSMETVTNRGIRRHVVHVADQQIDAFADTGRADLVLQYSEYLPMLVLTRLFGLPETEGESLVTSCAGMMRGGEDAIAHNDRIGRVLAELTAHKRAEPGPDFATGLIHHPAGLDDDEVQNHLRLVLIAAHTTTSNLLARVLQSILGNESRLGELISGEMTTTAIVEEMMWNSPPLAVLPGRFANADCELGGQRLRTGDLLILGLAAGNLDPEVRPHTGTAVSGNQAHLAFSSGPHQCPGQALGQAIIETAVEVLIQRLPGLRLNADPGRLTDTASTWETRLDHLPVTFPA